MDWATPGFHSIFICLFLSVPRWTIVSRKTSMVPAGASTQPLQSVFIPLFTKNVRGFCFAFIFLFQVQGRVPFAFCSGKLKNVTCCKSVCLNRHSWSCVWKRVGRIYETCGDVVTSGTKILVTSSDAGLLGWLVQGGVTGYLYAVLLNDRPIVNNSKGSEPEFCLLNVIIVALCLILIT